MRLALILGRNGDGGSESQAKILVAGLLAAGVEVDVLIVEGDGGVEGFGRAPVEVLVQRRRSGLLGLVDLARATVTLRKRLDSRRYDAVHAVMARAYVLAPIATFARRRRPRIVAWRRNEGVHLRDRSMSAAVEWIASRLTDQVACNSSAVRQYWLRRGHLSQLRSRVIPNALEDWRFEPSGCSEVRHPAGRVITVGGLKPVKGHLWLVESIGRLPAELRPQLVIVGEGQCRADLVSAARGAGVDLLLTGFVSDPRPWLEASEIYVQSSSSEGLSNALLEAMALGVAVVATDVGGTSEAVGTAGITIEHGDTDELVESLSKMLVDPAKRIRLGRDGARAASDRYGIARIVSSHLDLYTGMRRNRVA